MSDSVYHPRDVRQPTPAEVAVLTGLAHGKTRKAIAIETPMAYSTVLRHIYNVLHKLGAHTIEHAIYLAMKQGLIE